MKKLVTYFLLTLILFAGCKEPLPTELLINNLPEDQPLEIEVIASNPNDDFYRNGYDSTGIDPRPGNYNSVVAAIGAKITFNSYTREINHAEAFFYDRTKEIRAKNGRRLGFMTRHVSSIKFNGIFARQVPFIIKYRDNLILKDTVIGPKYVLHNIRNTVLGDTFVLPYSGFYNCEIRLQGNNILDFNIPTPNEITGKIVTRGKRSDNNLLTFVEWNGNNNGIIEIVIGGYNANGENTIPLFKLKVRDNGRVIIPKHILSAIPFDRFDLLVFTLNRKIETVKNENNSNILFTSSSIHSIYINLP